MRDTKGREYAERLTKLSGATWKQQLDVQRPYHWNIRRLHLGKTLEVGCGIGRMLAALNRDSIGIDHNKHSIKMAQKLGYNAYTTDEFDKILKKQKVQQFDSLLLAHVLEHLTTEDGIALLRKYTPFIKDKVVVICPQEKGFASDETHINFLKHKDIEQMLKSCGLIISKSYSFPFHKASGKFFTYNETVVVGQKPQ